MTLYRREGEPKRVRGRKVVGGYRYVPVEPCEHGNLCPHRYHRGVLRDGPCDPEMCDSSIHWFDCEGAALGEQP